MVNVSSALFTQLFQAGLKVHHIQAKYFSSHSSAAQSDQKHPHEADPKAHSSFIMKIR